MVTRKPGQEIPDYTIAWPMLTSGLAELWILAIDSQSICVGLNSTIAPGVQ